MLKIGAIAVAALLTCDGNASGQGTPTPRESKEEKGKKKQDRRRVARINSNKLPTAINKNTAFPYYVQKNDLTCDIPGFHCFQKIPKYANSIFQQSAGATENTIAINIPQGATSFQVGSVTYFEINSNTGCYDPKPQGRAYLSIRIKGETVWPKDRRQPNWPQPVYRGGPITIDGIPEDATSLDLVLTHAGNLAGYDPRFCNDISWNDVKFDGPRRPPTPSANQAVVREFVLCSGKNCSESSAKKFGAIRWEREHRDTERNSQTISLTANEARIIFKKPLDDLTRDDMERRLVSARYEVTGNQEQSGSFELKPNHRDHFRFLDHGKFLFVGNYKTENHHIKLKIRLYFISEP